MAWKDYETLDATPEKTPEETRKFYGSDLPKVPKTTTDERLKWAREQLGFKEEPRGGIISLREELEDLL